MKYLYYCITLLVMLCFVSCASDEPTDTFLPEGKHPMIFTTTVNELSTSRATTDNLWDGGEKIAIQIEGVVKQYISKNDGSLNSATPFYWRNSLEQKTVRAWYCGMGYSDTQPSSLTVQTDQSGNGYNKSDFLYALPQDFVYGSAANTLTFKHLPARVIVHLKNGDGLTADDVKNATVSIISQATTSGTINWNDGSIKQANPGNEEIIPHAFITPVADYQKSVQALVVPQQMQNKEFIKITIGTANAAREYYYIPQGNIAANLEAGKQYIYNVIVKKSGLKVTVNTTANWNDAIVPSGNVQEAPSFYVICPRDGVTDFNLSNYADKNGDKYTIKNNTFTISYKPKPTSISHRYYLKQGIANLSSPTKKEDGTITYTVSAIRGNLMLAFDERVEVGDYYYSDGTWSKFLYSDRTCIGIVFKTGVGMGDSINNYSGMNVIHGYVVALNYANNGNKLIWSTENVVTGVGTNVEYFDGYKNTQILKNIEGFKNKYPAAWSCVNNNGVAAPATSSGWYMPSGGQVKALYDVYENIIRPKLQIAGGSSGIAFVVISTSNEHYRNPERYVWRFTEGSFFQPAKSQESYARAILTF